jgi:hypothetical protein
MPSDSSQPSNRSLGSNGNRVGTLILAVLSIWLAASKLLWDIGNHFWPDTLNSYHQWTQRVYNERLASAHRIEERQLSEISKRLQNGQRLPDGIK